MSGNETGTVCLGMRLGLCLGMRLGLVSGNETGVDCVYTAKGEGPAESQEDTQTESRGQKSHSLHAVSYTCESRNASCDVHRI